MSANQGFYNNSTEYWMYQEAPTGESAAVGFDSITTTFNISISTIPDVTPSDFPAVQIYPAGDIVLIPVGVLSLIGDMTGTNDITLISTTASSSANSFILEKSRSGGVIVTGDTLGSLLFKGHDGTDYITASQIRSVNSGTVATDRIASNLLFYTHPDSTAASTLRLTIAPTGELTIATPDSGTALTISGGGLTSTGTTTLSSLGVGVMQTSSLGVVSSSNGTDGQILIGGGTAPTWAAITAGANITVTNAANSITIASTGGGSSFTWSEVTGTSQSMAVANGYILNNAGLVTATLPLTAAVGDIIEIVGKGAGGWLLAQNASQLIHFSSATTTTGVGGSLASTNQYDCVKIICTVTDTTWTVSSSIGNLTVV